jgi:hypothetical protein
MERELEFFDLPGKRSDIPAIESVVRPYLERDHQDILTTYGYTQFFGRVHQNLHLKRFG